jgi:fumarylacetoacetate (FAA) hydrolase family protein
MLPVWVKSLTTSSNIFGIAINPATKWIIAHTANRSPNIILILDSDGNLKGAYTYANIPSYDRFSRNLLLGYDSSTYNALVQTSLSSGNGYKLFAFTFSSSSSTPTFKWGFNSLD